MTPTRCLIDLNCFTKFREKDPDTKKLVRLGDVQLYTSKDNVCVLSVTQLSVLTYEIFEFLTKLRFSCSCSREATTEKFLISF